MFLKQFWTELFWSTKKKKKKDQLLFHYFSVSFTSELPGSLWGQSQNWQNTTGKAALTVFLAHQNFLEKASFHEISVPILQTKKTQDSSDKVQISIQIFSWARWTAKPFNMITSLFWDKGKKINGQSPRVAHLMRVKEEIGNADLKLNIQKKKN